MTWKSDDTIGKDYTYQFWGSRDVQPVSYSVSFEYIGTHYTIEDERS